jgi:hypothetical protein
VDFVVIGQKSYGISNQNQKCNSLFKEVLVYIQYDSYDIQIKCQNLIKANIEIPTSKTVKTFTAI